VLSQQKLSHFLNLQQKNICFLRIIFNFILLFINQILIKKLNQTMTFEINRIIERLLIKIF
jgi:hypothetical protein